MRPWTARATVHDGPRSPSTSTLQRLGQCGTQARAADVRQAPRSQRRQFRRRRRFEASIRPPCSRARRHAAIAAPGSSSLRTGRTTRSAMPSRSASDDASGLRRSAAQMTGLQPDAGAQEAQRLEPRQIEDDDEVGVGLLVEGGADLGRPDRDASRCGRAVPGILKARPPPARCWRRSGEPARARSLHVHLLV